MPRDGASRRRATSANQSPQEDRLNKEELARLQAYMRKTFANASLEVRAQPKKKDMAEVFIGGEFVATLYKIIEDGETEYQVQMCILEMDLEEA